MPDPQPTTEPPTPPGNLLDALDTATLYAARAAGVLTRLGEPTDATREDLERWAALNARVSTAISLAALTALLADLTEAAGG